MTEQAIELALPLVRRFEGLRLKPYLCPAGVATIGYGNTFYESGARVTLSDAPITKARAEELMRWTLRQSVLPQVVWLCPGIRKPQQLAALLDFPFNLGPGHLRASTLRRRVNEGAWDRVPAELRKWNRAGGRVLQGLVLRREAECALFDTSPR